MSEHESERIERSKLSARGAPPVTPATGVPSLSVSRQGQPVRTDQPPAVDHSALAMEAARRMRRVKHKEKYGRVVCHHLKQMLTGQASVPVQPLSKMDVMVRKGNRQVPYRSGRQISLGL